jgi:hypothetical protein
MKVCRHCALPYTPKTPIASLEGDERRKEINKVACIRLRNIVGQCSDENCACALIVARVDFESTCTCKQDVFPWNRERRWFGHFCMARCLPAIEDFQLLLPETKAYYTSSLDVTHEASSLPSHTLNTC